MLQQDAKASASAASLALLVMIFCIGAFVPPFNGRTLDSVVLIVTFAVGIGVSLAAHLWFVGVTARQLGRSAGLWVALALFTLPIGSIIGLILVERAVPRELDHSAAGGAA